MNGQELLDFLKSLPKESLRKVVLLGSEHGFAPLFRMDDSGNHITLEDSSS